MQCFGYTVIHSSRREFVRITCFLLPTNSDANCLFNTNIPQIQWCLSYPIGILKFDVRISRVLGTCISQMCPRHEPQAHEFQWFSSIGSSSEPGAKWNSWFSNFSYGGRRKQANMKKPSAGIMFSELENANLQNTSAAVRLASIFSTNPHPRKYSFRMHG